MVLTAARPGIRKTQAAATGYFVGAATSTLVGSGGEAVITPPAGVAVGDVVLWVTRGDNAVTPPFATEVDEGTANGGNYYSWGWHRLASGDLAGPWTFGTGGAAADVVAVAVYRGVIGSPTFEPVTKITTLTATTVTMPAFSSLQSGTVVVRLLGTASNPPPGGLPTFTAGATQRAAKTASVYWSVGIADAQESGGSVPAVTATWPGASDYAYTTVVLSIGTASFTEDYNRSDREIVGDNGWYTTQSSPNTGVQGIVSNRLRPLTASSGFPGSSGTIGAPIGHDVVHANADIVDVSFDLVTGVLVGTGNLYVVVGGTKSGGAPQTIDSGVLLRMFINGSPNNLLVQKITATNSTTDHSPGTYPPFPASATTTIRIVLVRSTGVVKIYQNGTLQYTSAAGDFSGLTGSIVAFQFEKAYSTTPIEVDNVQAI